MAQQNDSSVIFEKYLTVSVLDYIVMGAMLLASLGIGIFYSCKQKTQEEYLHGGRRLPLIPVSFSLVVSFLSAVTMQVMFYFIQTMTILNTYRISHVFRAIWWFNTHTHIYAIFDNVIILNLWNKTYNKILSICIIFVLVPHRKMYTDSLTCELSTILKCTRFESIPS